MFKYLKTLDNSTHPSDIYTFSYSPEAFADGFSVSAGTIIAIVYGEICTSFSYDLPLYLVIAVENDGATAKCIRLSSGMVIEGSLYSGVELDFIRPGYLVALHTDGYEKGVTFTDAGEKKFELMDTSRKESGIVTAVVL